MTIHEHTNTALALKPAFIKNVEIFEAMHRKLGDHQHYYNHYQPHTIVWN